MSGALRLQGHARNALIAGLLVLWLLPLAAVALTSIRSIEELHRGEYWSWPAETMLVQNYAEVLFASDTGRFILNSFLVVFPAVAGTLLLAVMAGYALASYRFRGNLLILALFIGGNLVPYQILAIPVRSLIHDLGLYDSRTGLVLFHMAFQTGFATLFMRNFIRQLPPSLIDAARIDGVGELRILLYVVVPLIRPAIAAVAVLVFTFVWNDFFWSLVLTHSTAVRPVTAGLQTLRGMWLTSWHLSSAAAILAALPPALLFFLMQRHFIAGLTRGVTGD